MCDEVVFSHNFSSPAFSKLIKIKSCLTFKIVMSGQFCFVYLRYLLVYLIVYPVITTIYRHITGLIFCSIISSLTSQS